MVWWLIPLKVFRIGADRLQKHSSRFSLQLKQLSTISSPYGVFTLPPCLTYAPGSSASNELAHAVETGGDSFDRNQFAPEGGSS